MSNSSKNQNIFLVGYGSLINKKSRLNTGKNNIGEAVPIKIKENSGLKRTWSFRNPNMTTTVLCLENCKNTQNYKYRNDIFVKGYGKEINAVIFPVYKDIENFDKREKGYARIRLKKDQIKTLIDYKIPLNSKIYVYVKTGTSKNKCDFPISQRYLDIVTCGCLEYGEKFLFDFMNSTDNWCKTIINDRVNKNMEKVDEILNQLIHFNIE